MPRSLVVPRGEFMTAVSGHLISTSDVSARPPLPWPLSASSRSNVADIVARVETDSIVARVGTSNAPQIGPYRQIDTAVDHTNETFWYHMRPAGPPSFNQGVL